MPNDAKLGFLVGVVGVLAAAVLFANHQVPAGSPPGAVTPVATAAHAAPPPAATLARPAPAVQAAVPVVPVTRGRKEVEGVTTSRVNRDDE